MRFYDPASAAVMRKAARGPAEIALRQNRLLYGAQVPTNPSVSRMTTGGSLGVLYRTPGNIQRNPYKLGALGASPLVSTVASKGGAVAATAGGSSIASAMGAGAAAGPIGLVVGAIVGIVLSKIFAKQYLDVTSANNIADASLGVFKQYQAIAGQVAGRDIGLASMNAIWKGAMYSGLFPLNNQQLCFHNGCLKYRGQPEWIEATINGPDNQFTLGGVYNNFLMAARTATTAGASTVNSVAVPINRTGMTRVALQGLGHRRHQGFSGLGALGAINGVPEAVVLVDNYLIPANTRDNPAWLVPRTALEHQILYDVADAWLAQKHPEINTTPYVANPATPASAPAVPQPSAGPVPPPNLPVPVTPSQPMPVIPPLPTPNFPNQGYGIDQLAPTGGTGAGGGISVVPPMGTQPVTVSAPAQSAPTVATASLGPSALFSNPWMILVLAGMALAIVPPMLKKESA
jgi:hypothetical protein